MNNRKEEKGRGKYFSVDKNIRTQGIIHIARPLPVWIFKAGTRDISATPGRWFSAYIIKQITPARQRAAEHFSLITTAFPLKPRQFIILPSTPLNDSSPFTSEQTLQGSWCLSLISSATCFGVLDEGKEEESNLIFLSRFGEASSAPHPQKITRQTEPSGKL